MDPMKRAATLVLAFLTLLVFPALPASADLGMTTTMSMNAGGMAVNATAETRLKATKMRADIKLMQQDTSVLFDAVTKEVWMVNHATREIRAADPSAMADNLPVTFGEAAVSMKPTGQSKEILGRTCQGYAVEMTVPMSFGQESITMRMAGTIWIADKGPGVEEYKALSRAAAESGFSTSFMAQGPTAKAMVEMQKTMADAGIPLAQEFRMTMEGTGQAAAALAQFGNMTMTMAVTALSTDPIADDVFALPAGYAKR
jgi:hypothetical protein